MSPAVGWRTLVLCYPNHYLGCPILDGGHEFVSNVADYHLNIQAAMEEARFTVSEKLGCNIIIESRVGTSSLEKLRAMGHVLDVRKEYSSYMGRGQAVLHDSTTKINYGASDPRADDAAIPETPRFSGSAPKQ